MRNYSFDVLKLFLALLVVFIHIHVPWREVILPLTRCAVPCFFMISGYFLYNLDMENMKKKTSKRYYAYAIYNFPLQYALYYTMVESLYENV